MSADIERVRAMTPATRWLELVFAAATVLACTSPGCASHHTSPAATCSAQDSGAAGRAAASDSGSASGAMAKDSGAADGAVKAGVGKAADGGVMSDDDAALGALPSGLFFSAYKDTSINMNWNTNVISTNVSGSPTPLSDELAKHSASTVTLAFATGECGSENWAGVSGAMMASTNVPLLSKAQVRYVLSTGGAAGSFTCGNDQGFAKFLDRWASPNLVGVDFDIEAGQSGTQIGDLMARIKAAHATHPALRFSLTLATLANNDGAAKATSLGSAAADSFNTYGDQTLMAVKSTLGFSGDPASWPSYVTVNLMTMDYGAPSKGVCVVSASTCQMGESALQAAYNLHDTWGVPYRNIELTPMIGGNDASDEKFSLTDVDTVSAFAIARGLAGVHFWSYDRDVDCAAGSASPTCNTMGAGYAGPSGYLKRFLRQLH